MEGKNVKVFPYHSYRLIWTFKVLVPNMYYGTPIRALQCLKIPLTGTMRTTMWDMFCTRCHLPVKFHEISWHFRFLFPKWSGSILAIYVSNQREPCPRYIDWIGGNLSHSSKFLPLKLIRLGVHFIYEYTTFLLMWEQNGISPNIKSEWKIALKRVLEFWSMIQAMWVFPDNEAVKYRNVCTQVIQNRE